MCTLPHPMVTSSSLIKIGNYKIPCFRKEGGWKEEGIFLAYPTTINFEWSPYGLDVTTSGIVLVLYHHITRKILVPAYNYTIDMVLFGAFFPNVKKHLHIRTKNFALSSFDQKINKFCFDQFTCAFFCIYNSIDFYHSSIHSSSTSEKTNQRQKTETIKSRMS